MQVVSGAKLQVSVLSMVTECNFFRGKPLVGVGQWRVKGGSEHEGKSC